MSNSFQLCSTHFSRSRKFCRGFPHCYGTAIEYRLLTLFNCNFSNLQPNYRLLSKFLKTRSQRWNNCTNRTSEIRRVIYCSFADSAAKCPRHAVRSGVTDGGQGASCTPWQAKCKNWAPLVDILICSIL